MKYPTETYELSTKTMRYLTETNEICQGNLGIISRKPTKYFNETYKISQGNL